MEHENTDERTGRNQPVERRAPSTALAVACQLLRDDPSLTHGLLVLWLRTEMRNSEWFEYETNVHRAAGVIVDHAVRITVEHGFVPGALLVVSLTSLLLRFRPENHIQIALLNFKTVSLSGFGSDEARFAAEAKHRVSPRGLQPDWLVPEPKTLIRTRDMLQTEAVLRNLREPYSSDFLPLARCGAVVPVKVIAGL